MFHLSSVSFIWNNLYIGIPKRLVGSLLSFRSVKGGKVMTFDFTDLAFMTGIVAAFSEFLKLIKVRVTWIPIFNMLFGVVLGFIYVSPDDPKQALMAGILIGLSANGLYTGVSIEVGKANKEVGNDPKEKG